MLVWICLTLAVAGVAFVAGQRRQGRRLLRAVAADVAALRPDRPAEPADRTGEQAHRTGEQAHRTGEQAHRAGTPAAGRAGEPVSATLDEIRAGLRDVGELLRERAAEVERMHQDREERAHAAEAEQRRLNGRLRRRAKEAIDDTGAVIGERLRDVVEQVGAAREVTTATHERVASTSAAAAAMVRRARSADEVAVQLNESLRQVAGIAGVISEIASQTRMLALNATIEAARAGAAGKGFAVVADEVKSLADTTASSTEQIAATVATLEGDVKQVGETLTAIIQDVGEIETAMGLLDGIADDQHRIVEGLGGTVEATMLQIADLSEVAERLERRRADRLATDGAVTLRIGARPEVAGRVTDLSSGGIGCTVPAHTTVRPGDAVQAVLDVDGVRVPVAAEVMRRREVDGGIELGLQFTEVGLESRRQIDAHINQRFENS